jgi:hypothetical protein
LRTYICLITDDRYAVPSLVFENAPDDEAMRALALEALRSNPHYVDFEAKLDDRSVFLINRAALDVSS